MAVHTLGTTTTPASGGNDTAAYHEIANHAQQNMPYSGYVTDVFVHFGATSGSITAQILLFDGSYNLVSASSGRTVSSEAWQRYTLATPYYRGAGLSIGAGFFSLSSLHFSIYSTGTWQGSSTTTPIGGYNSFDTPGSPYVQGGIGYYFYWIDPLQAVSASPAIAAPGQSITISGYGFVGGTITGIDFNGTAASTWTVVDDTTLTVTVPVGATTGNITVNSDHGSGSFAFTVSSAHVFRSGVETNGQGVYVVRSGTPSMSQGVLRWKNGAWVNGQ